MEKMFLDIAKEKYRFLPNHFEGKDDCYIIKSTDKKDNFSFENTHCTELILEKGIAEELLKKAKLLYCDVTLKKSDEDSFFSVLKKMEQLEFLQTSIHNILKFNNSIPNLKYLAILNRVGDIEKLAPDKKYHEKLQFPELIFPNVEALSLINLLNVEEIMDGYIGISQQNFPRLEYLSCSLDKKARALDLINKFTGLLHLKIGGVRVNIFDDIKSQLLSLQIEGAGKEFKLAQMKKNPSIEMIRFNSIYGGIDCEDFLLMPNLKEIHLSNTSKVINIEALLRIKTLKSLHVTNCKGSFNKRQKCLFKTHLFDYLNIDYA